MKAHFTPLSFCKVSEFLISFLRLRIGSRSGLELFCILNPFTLSITPVTSFEGLHVSPFMIHGKEMPRTQALSSYNSPGISISPGLDCCSNLIETTSLFHNKLFYLQVQGCDESLVRALLQDIGQSYHRGRVDHFCRNCSS